MTHAGLVRPKTIRARLHRLTRVLAFGGLASLGTGAEPAPGLTATALAPRSGPRGATLFTLLPPGQTGLSVENTYGDPRMWSDRYQELAYGAIGSGVAIGDYDNDGRPDIVVVSKTEGHRLFRNLGNWRFEDVTERAGLSHSPGFLEQGVAWAKRLLTRDAAPDGALDPWYQGATFADVNNDGWLDLYVCRFDAPNLLYINQRNGSFKEEAADRGLAIRDASGMAAFCDYDRDGWLDVYLQTNFLNASQNPKGQRDYLFRNNGDGTFSDVTARAGLDLDPTAGHSATWWDYDGDGWPDLYVANDFATPDRLYRNNGDGTFANVIDTAMPHTPYYAMGSDLGDVNNDGRIDLFVADMATTSHEKDQRGMASSRARAQENPETFPAAPQYMRNALYLATGTPYVLEAGGLAGLHATDWTWSVRLEDLDNDGRIDLHVTNGMTREYHNADLLERLMQSEDLAEPRRIMKMAPIMAENNLAFRNLGDLQFENVSRAWGLDEAWVSFGAAFGDLDGDGDLDLVYTNYARGVTLLRNDSDSGHRLIVALRGTRSNRLGAGARVEVETAGGLHVRQLVLARGYLSSSEPVLHFGLGPHERIQRLTVQWPSGYVQNFSNLTANQRLTISEPPRGTGVSPSEGGSRPVAEPLPAQSGTEAVPLQAQPLFIDVSESLGLSIASREPPAEGTLPQPLLPLRFNRRGPGLAVGDLDGDGRDDMVLGGTTLDPARILTTPTKAAGAAAVTPLVSISSATVNDGPLLVFDADGDGDLDLLITQGGANLPADSPAYQPRLSLNDGRGDFSAAPQGALPAFPISAGTAVAADFDRDGRLDLLIGSRVRPRQYPLPGYSALLRNLGGGRFEDVTATLAPGLREIGLVTSALWTDLDDDGWLDLLVSLEWGGIRAWINVAEDPDVPPVAPDVARDVPPTVRRFVDRSEELGFTKPGTGWWTALTAADFNGDGRPDYVVGNVGLNTPYRASPEAPALLFHADFRDGGKRPPQLVEAYFENGLLYPRRTRKELGAEIPTVLRRFPRNDAFARATLAEILGEEALASARRFTATEFRSGVFLSQADGTFTFSALPRLAQLAPLQGVVAGDFDGDGHADVLAAQNSFAPGPSIGRFSGGLGVFLRGDGQGNFTATAPLESGVIVPGDAKALVALDLDDDAWPDFLVARNNGTTLAFRNARRPGGNSFAVELRGPASNPTAVGARVTVENSDGTTQTTEVYAGSGYMSQSSASLFFGYLSGHPARLVRIRWPSGAETVHPLDVPPRGTVVFTTPGR